MDYPINKKKKLEESELSKTVNRINEESAQRLRMDRPNLDMSESTKQKLRMDRPNLDISESTKQMLRMNRPNLDMDESTKQMLRMDKGIESKSQEYKPEIEIETKEYKPGLNRKPDSVSIEVKGLLSSAKKKPKMDMEEKSVLSDSDKSKYEAAMNSESKYLETLRKRKAK